MPQIEWNEDPDEEYFTDKPAWDCYGALSLWAAYEQLPNATRPMTAEGWENDPAFLTNRIDSISRYQHLMADTEIWLPLDLSKPVRTVAVDWSNVTVGSSPRLLNELRDLNSRTWQASDAQIDQWCINGAEFGCPLETSARFGFSVFYKLTSYSVERCMPMKLDY